MDVCQALQANKDLIIGEYTAYKLMLEEAAKNGEDMAEV
jgi:hypothetical protein